MTICGILVLSIEPKFLKHLAFTMQHVWVDDVIYISEYHVTSFPTPGQRWTWSLFTSGASYLLNNIRNMTKTKKNIKNSKYSIKFYFQKQAG